MPRGDRTAEPGRRSPVRESDRGSPVGLPLIEVEVPAGNETQWLRELTSRWAVRARVELCRPMFKEPSALLQLVELVGAPTTLKEAERYLAELPGLRELTVLHPSPSRSVVRAVSALPRACGLALRSGAICTACRYLPASDGGRRDRWSVLLPRTPQVARLLASLSDGGAARSPTVLRSKEYRPRSVLSERQATAIETAFRLGFYEFPRRTDLGQVARALGISRSATSELLRRAEGKLLEPVLSPP